MLIYFSCHPGGLGTEQRHLVYSQAEGQDSLRQAILYDYNNKNKRKASQKKEFQHGVRIGFFSAAHDGSMVKTVGCRFRLCSNLCSPLSLSFPGKFT